MFKFQLKTVPVEENQSWDISFVAAMIKCAVEKFSHFKKLKYPQMLEAVKTYGKF